MRHVGVKGINNFQSAHCVPSTIRSYRQHERSRVQPVVAAVLPEARERGSKSPQPPGMKMAFWVCFQVSEDVEEGGLEG